jgi:hypothetical protein
MAKTREERLAKQRAYMKAWRAARPPEKLEELRAISRARHARIKADPELWAAELEKRRAADRRRHGHAQPTGETRSGACEICCRVGKLQLDHDHETGAARGWLCGSCNRGIGLLQDSPKLLAQAINYLQTRIRLVS